MNHSQASILEPQEVARVLGTDLTRGLSSLEASERLKKHGLNKINNATYSSLDDSYLTFLLSVLERFLNPPFLILMICAGIGIVFGDYNSLVGVAVSLSILTSITAIMLQRTNRSSRELSKQIVNLCEVRRDGALIKVEADHLVPGDIVQLATNQKVPADLRLFDLQSITVNETSLTGLPKLQAKFEEPVKQELASVLSGTLKIDAETDQINQNLAFMGTQIIKGQAKGIVILTGRASRYGQMYSLLKNSQHPNDSFLSLTLNQASMELAVVSYLIITFAAISGIIRHRSALELIHMSTSLAIVAIPEGLPVVLELILASASINLNEKKAIIKDRKRFELLSCVQVLFLSISDVTSTLEKDLKQLLGKLRKDLLIDVKLITEVPPCVDMALDSQGNIDESIMSGNEIARLIESSAADSEKLEEIKSKSLFYCLDAVQKSQLIRRLQESGKIVAMVGNGVNDASAMRQANFSITTSTGAEICQEIADMIVLEHDLCALPEAVAESRSIVCRLRGFLSYQVSLSLTLITLSSIFQAEPPFTILQLLFLNLLIDGPFGLISCAQQVKLDENGNKLPCDLNERLINSRCLGLIVALSSTLFSMNGAFYYILLLDGDEQLEDRSRMLILICFLLSTVVVAVISRLRPIRRFLSS